MTSAFKNSALALTTCLVTGLIGGQLLAQGDAEAGEKVFKRCKTCHQIGEGAKNRSGPVLTGIVGNAAGMAEGYKYSKALKAAGENGLVWSITVHLESSHALYVSTSVLPRFCHTEPQ